MLDTVAAPLFGSLVAGRVDLTLFLMPSQDYSPVVEKHLIPQETDHGA